MNKESVILKGKELAPFMHGMLSYDTTPDTLIPYRFSEKQMSVYSMNDNFSVRARASAGIRFVCETDADELTIRSRIFVASGQDIYGLDLLVDGKLLEHQGGKTSEYTGEEIKFTLPSGMKKIELFLPQLAGTEICSVSLRHASIVRCVQYERRMLNLGDSITQGYIARFPSETYVSRIATMLGIDFVNQGVGGDTFRPETLTNDIFKPDLIISAYGTNDWSTVSVENITCKTEQYFEKLTEYWPDVPTYILTPIWRVDNGKKTPAGIPFEEWRINMTQMASVYPQMKVIPGETLFPRIKELFADLWLHPDDLGFREYADRLITYLK